MIDSTLMPQARIQTMLKISTLVAAILQTAFLALWLPDYLRSASVDETVFGVVRMGVTVLAHASLVLFLFVLFSRQVSRKN